MGGLVGLFRLLRNRNSLHFSLLTDPSIHPPGGTPLDTDDGCDGGMDFCCANAEAKSKQAATPIWQIPRSRSSLSPQKAYLPSLALRIFSTSVQAMCMDFSLTPYGVSPNFPGVIR